MMAFDVGGFVGSFLGSLSVVVFWANRQFRDNASLEFAQNGDGHATNGQSNSDNEPFYIDGNAPKPIIRVPWCGR